MMGGVCAMSELRDQLRGSGLRNQTMSDDLRTRISAAIARADQDWCSDNPLHEDMADAVISELQLTVLGDGIVVGVIHE